MSKQQSLFPSDKISLAEKNVAIHCDIKFNEPEPDDVVFQHSAFCQTFLPYRGLKDPKKGYIKTQGRLKTILLKNYSQQLYFLNFDGIV